MRTPSPLPVLLAAVLFLGPPMGARALDGGDPPAPQDNRFFPKEMEDALKAMAGSDPEDSFQEGLATLARLRGRDGGREGLREGAFAPILAHALATRLEHIASFAGEILVSLDARRLLAEVRKEVEDTSDPVRLFNAAVLLEEIPPVPEPESVEADSVSVLLRILGKGKAAARTRVAEALGEVAAARRGIPEKVRDRAAQAVLGLYGSSSGDPDLQNVCAVALGKIGSPRAIPALLQGLGRTEGKHGFVAALALGWIEDPSVFPSVHHLQAGGGESLESWAKALDHCARESDLPALVATLANSGRPEAREAAAVALGRLLPALPAPGVDGAPAGTTREEKERSALRAQAASALYDRMVGDSSARVQWACFHAVSRAGGPWLGSQAVKLLQSPNQAHVIRAIHLCGDWKVAAAAKPLVAGGIFGAKDDFLRKRCAVEFFRIGDAVAIEEFRTKMKGLEGGVAFSRGCDALGQWRSPDGFRLALDLLRSTREGSQEQFAVEMALEEMTGHLFGPFPAIWTKWFEKNPGFFSPRQARIERERWREEFDKENKGFRQTKETEKAVQRGLEYLARHQDVDGAWDAARFKDRCDRVPACSVSTGARVQEDNVSRTALSILAFLGAGYTPEAGKYKTALRRGLEYLMARQQACGDYLTNDLIGGYNRPLALQAYAEACAVTHDPRYLPFVQRAADFLAQIQNSIGGWRYRVDVETSDSSVAAWMLFAMKAAEKAGAHVRPVVFEGTRVLFRRYSVRVPQNGPREDFVDIDPSYGFEVGKDAKYEFSTGYQDRAYAPTHATTALGLMSHVLMGYRRSHPFCIGSANFILAKQLPEVPKEGNWDKLNIKQEYPMYFMYYGTLSMHQMGGRYFRTWNDRIRTILPATQIQTGCARGSWKGTAYDGFFGSLYTAAVGVLTLETYYRYLPVLQD